MSLLILVAGVVAGITVIVLAVHLTGGSDTATLADADEARQRFELDFPGEAGGEVWLTRDRKAAFLSLGGGRLGIVHGIGRHFLTRNIGAADISGAERSGTRLSIRLRDFTWGGGDFEFRDASQAEAVLDALRLASRSDQREAV